MPSERPHFSIALLPMLLLAAVIAGCGATGGNAGTGSKPVDSNAADHMVRVPSVTGENLQSAYAKLHRSGLAVTFTRTFGLTPNAYCFPLVSRQSRAAGSEVTAGTAVVLTAKPATCALGSVGTPTGRMPQARVRDFVGRPLRVALRWVNAHRLTWEVLRFPGVTDGDAGTLFGNYTVTAQHPRPGSVLRLATLSRGGAAYTPLTLKVRARRSTRPRRAGG